MLSADLPPKFSVPIQSGRSGYEVFVALITNDNSDGKRVVLSQRFRYGVASSICCLVDWNLKSGQRSKTRRKSRRTKTK